MKYQKELTNKLRTDTVYPITVLNAIRLTDDGEGLLSDLLNNKVDKDGAKVLSTNDYTTAEKTKLFGIEAGADVNQNAFSVIKVTGQPDIPAEHEMENLTFVAGSNVTITTNSSNKTISIAATGTLTGATNATDVTIADTGGYYSSGSVEGALQEVATTKVNKQELYTTANITYYVATTGSNSNNGLTAGSPFQTIVYALSKVPKNVRHTVTINVASGTYNETIYVTGHYGNGSINILGGVDLATSVNFKVNKIDLTRNTCYVHVRGFEVTNTIDHSAVSEACLKVLFQFITTIGSTTSYNGFYIDSSKVRIDNCVASNKSSALYALDNSDVFSYNWTVGSGNTTGISARNGAKIAKLGTQPQGTISENVANGGIITSGVLNPAPINNPTFTGTVNGITALMVGALPTSGGTVTGTFNLTGNQYITGNLKITGNSQSTEFIQGATGLTLNSTLYGGNYRLPRIYAQTSETAPGTMKDGDILFVYTA